MKNLIFFLLFLPSSAWAADIYDAFVRDVQKQNIFEILAMNDSVTTIRDKSGATADVNRDDLNAAYKRIPVEESRLSWVNKVILGRELSRLDTLRAQKDLVTTMMGVCTAEATMCVYLASSAIVFWPNGVIAGACAGLAFVCNAYADEIRQDLDKKIGTEIERLKSESQDSIAPASIEGSPFDFADSKGGHGPVESFPSCDWLPATEITSSDGGKWTTPAKVQCGGW